MPVLNNQKSYAVENQHGGHCDWIVEIRVDQIVEQHADDPGRHHRHDDFQPQIDRTALFIGVLTRGKRIQLVEIQ